jgi:hypothetical protein
MKEAIGLELDMLNILYVRPHFFDFDLANGPPFSVFVLSKFSLCKTGESSTVRLSLV